MHTRWTIRLARPAVKGLKGSCEHRQPMWMRSNDGRDPSRWEELVVHLGIQPACSLCRMTASNVCQECSMVLLMWWCNSHISAQFHATQASRIFSALQSPLDCSPCTDEFLLLCAAAFPFLFSQCNVLLRKLKNMASSLLLAC